MRGQRRAGAAARGSRWADGFTEEIVPNLLSELDGAKKSDRHVFLLAATNHRDRIDPAIRDRFTYEIEIPKPTPEQRRRLFAIFLGGQPVDFGLQNVIPCWTEGVSKMKVGEKARLTCPSDSAYGDQGQGPIPPGATLVFDVELLSIK